MCKEKSQSVQLVLCSMHSTLIFSILLFTVFYYIFFSFVRRTWTIYLIFWNIRKQHSHAQTNSNWIIRINYLQSELQKFSRWLNRKNRHYTCVIRENSTNNVKLPTNKYICSSNFFVFFLCIDVNVALKYYCFRRKDINMNKYFQQTHTQFDICRKAF